MKLHSGPWLLSATLLLAPSVAPAVTLSTTFVNSPAGTNVNCNVVNGGKKSIQVVIRVRDIGGAILSESGSFEIAPQQGNGIGDDANEDYFGWCEFEVKGPRKGVRASLQLKPGGNEAPVLVVPAY